MSSAVSVLVVSRFFLPAESAAQGDTLWIVLLWLFCAAAWLCYALRTERSLRRPDWLTAGVAMLVAGHVVAALWVMATAGDKRAALNMLWEWIGIALAAGLTRSVLSTQAGRRQILLVILVSGVVLSGLGLWQHFVWYPRISTQLAELVELERQTRAEGAPPHPADLAERARRTESLRRELGWMPPVEDGAARMFRDRVQASTEPIGRFALANTFAGLLLAALMIGAGAAAHSLQRGAAAARLVGLAAGLLMIGYCLWLTKSRTAWVGALAAAAVMGLVSRGGSSGRRWGLWSAGAAVLLAMPLVAAWSGSLDREVLSEAPKSLLYRLEYWRATGRLIADHWLLGVGPGNFRQHYLQYKLPGSSEEILDPHNLFLDAWANGGLISLGGLIVLLGVAARSAAGGVDEREEPAGATSATWLRSTVHTGVLGVAAIAVAAACELLGGNAVDGYWIALLAGWWGAAAVISSCPQLAAGRAALTAAFVGLVVHLTGAGGIAMPAILQVLLILVFSISDHPGAEDVPGPDRRTGSHAHLSLAAQRVLLAVVLVLLVGCALTGALPVTREKAGVGIGRTLWQVDGQPAAAERAFLQAANDDPLSPEPWQELTALRMARWSQSSRNEDFQAALDALTRAIDRDPLNAGRWRSLGQLWMTRLERHGDPQAAENAVRAYSRAVELYPNLAAHWSDLAKAASHAGDADRARQAAGEAVRLDELNRRRGHVDKFLSDTDLDELRSLIADSPNRDR